MNFDLSEEQQIIVDSVAKFVRNDSPVERFRKLRASDPGWEASVWERMGEYGWLGAPFPEEQGGFGGRFLDAALILEQLGRGLVPEPYAASVVLAGGLLSRFGSEAQIEELLAPMLAGRTSLALAYAERQSRYDLADCRTTARRVAQRVSCHGQADRGRRPCQEEDGRKVQPPGQPPAHRPTAGVLDEQDGGHDAHARDANHAVHRRDCRGVRHRGCGALRRLVRQRPGLATFGRHHPNRSFSRCCTSVRAK